MKKTMLISSILMLILIIPLVTASVSSVTTSSSTTRATTGTSVTISATVTATGSESGSIQLITSPSGITVSDPASGQYQGVSLSSTPTTKAFTISAGTANTYTYYATSGGTSSTEQTIVFVDPSALTVSGSPSSQTVATGGGSFILRVNIQNSQSSAITTSYALNLPSGYSTSGDSTLATTTIAASSTTSLTWNVTTSSSSGTIIFSLGDNSNAFSTSVTVPTTITTTTTTTTTAAGNITTPGIKITVQKGKVNVTIPSIAAGKSAVVSINKTEDVAFRLISITVKNSVNNIQINVTKLADKPATITQEITGKVYHYIQVDKNITDTNINQTSIRFEVEKSWLDANNINKSTIALNRYSDNVWNKLQTTEMSEDTATVLYEAISPGLSVFAISGEVKTAAPAEVPVAPPVEEKKEILPAAITKGKGLLITILVIAIAAIGIVFYLVKKNVIKLSTIFPRRSGWDELKKKYSRR